MVAHILSQSSVCPRKVEQDSGHHVKGGPSPGVLKHPNRVSQIWRMFDRAEVDLFDSLRAT